MLNKSGNKEIKALIIFLLFVLLVQITCFFLEDRFPHTMRDINYGINILFLLLFLGAFYLQIESSLWLIMAILFLLAGILLKSDLLIISKIIFLICAIIHAIRVHTKKNSIN